LKEKGTVTEFTTINPAAEEVINTYKIMTKDQINEKVKKAQDTSCELKIVFQMF
jgi:acyl-CoA reductase-like NAD-dependent aldehyde dehydrogenase